MHGEFTRQAAIVVCVEGLLVQLRLHGVAVSVERRRVRRVAYLQVLRQVVERDGWHGRASDSEFARGATSEDTGDVAIAPSAVPPVL